MIKLEKYQHIVAHKSKSHITKGDCYIFPKLDGANCQIWKSVFTDIDSGDSDSIICCASRNGQLSEQNNNQKFFQYVQSESRFTKFFEKYPDLRLYGEWLVPHTLKTYKPSAWNKFYVFDVCYYDEKSKLRYLSYPEYLPKLIEFDIDYIPAIHILNPTEKDLQELLMNERFLIDDDFISQDRFLEQCTENSTLLDLQFNKSQIGEGIIIKNYEMKYNMTWEKLIDCGFKEEFCSKNPNNANPKTEREKMPTDFEEFIVEKYVTLHLINKNHAKIMFNNNTWLPKHMPELIKNITTDLFIEEMVSVLEDRNIESNVIEFFENTFANGDNKSDDEIIDQMISFLKKMKIVINLKTLKSMVLRKVKEMKPNLSKQKY